MRNSSFEDMPMLSLQQRTVEFLQRTHWPTLISGLAIGMAAMQLLVARSVTLEVDRLSRQVAEVNTQMNQLAGSATDVQRTNDLLANLGRQKDDLLTARQTIEELRRLRAQIEQESGRLGNSVSVLQQLHKLQTDIVAQADEAAEATRAIEVVEALNRQVAEMSRGLPEQAASLADAQAALTALSELKNIILANADACSLARDQVQSVVGIAQALADGAEDITSARVAASELVALKDGLIDHAADVAASQSTAEQLLSLNDTLADARQIQLDDAQRNLQSLVRVQQELASQSGALAASIEHLDLMADFQNLLGEQFTKLEGMRRQLTDLVLMETTIDRAARALAPLAEIGNLRNLDDQELRMAARTILERRAAQSSVRMAERPEDVISVSSPDTDAADPARPAPVPPIE